jgi:hypothetical protein
MVNTRTVKSEQIEAAIHARVIAHCIMHGTCNHGNTGKIDCTHVHYTPSLMNPPVQERSFFSGDGDEHHFKNETTTASKTGTSATSSPEDTSIKPGRPPDIYRANRTE